MTLLFDVSPTDDPERKKSKSRRRADGASEKVESPKKRLFTRESPSSAILGRINDTFDCGDGACNSQCHDILVEDRGEWRIACAFCGTAQWVDAIPGHLKPREQEFVLHEGRFAGMTFAEIERHPRGSDYITWAAASHPKQIVRDAAKKHLDRHKVTR